MITIYCQSTHLKISYQNASSEEKKLSEKILTTKFCARDTSMSHNPLVKRKILSDIKYFYNTEYNILPIGFLYYLEHYYKEENIQYDIVDMREFPFVDKNILKQMIKGEFHYNGLYPRDYQLEAVMTVIKNKGGIISSPVGTGKTLMIAMLLSIYSKSKILILFNTTDLIAQTYNDLLSYGFTQNDIGVIQGTNFDDTKRITLLSVQSYEKAFHIFPYINVIIVDEVHENGRTNVAEKIIYSCQNAPIRIGLSATPWSDNPYETMRLYGNIGPIVYETHITQQIQNGNIANTFVELYNYDAPSIIPKGIWADIYDMKKINKKNKEEDLVQQGYEIITFKGEKYARKFIEYGDEYTHFVNNENRNKKIIEVITHYVKKNKRILVIFNRLEHGQILKSMYPDGILIHGNESLQNRKKAKEILQTKPGTVIFASNIWYKGINIPEIDVFINATGGHSSVRVVQKLGRVVRKSKNTHKPIAIAVDFIDNGLSRIGKSQTNKRINVYKNILKLPILYK